MSAAVSFLFADVGAPTPDHRFWASLPEPLVIPRRGGAVRLRAMCWGPTTTAAEAARRDRAHVQLAKDEAAAKALAFGDAPAKIRRLVESSWRATFKGTRSDDDRDDLVSVVLLAVAEQFSPAEIASPEHGRVVAFASKVVDCALADLVNGIGRKRTGIANTRRDQRYADTPTFFVDGDRGPEEHVSAGQAPSPYDVAQSLGRRTKQGEQIGWHANASVSPTESELVNAIDERRRPRPLESEHDEHEIDRTPRILSKLFGAEWTPSLEVLSNE